MTKEATAKTLTGGKDRNIYLGGDPEIFLSSKGSTIGSERVIPAQGWQIQTASIIRDGVQAEIRLPPFTCRETGADYLAYVLRHLRLILLDQFPSFKIDFRQVVEVSQEELESLSNASRVLGCAPSKNIYDAAAAVEVPLDKLHIRSAGGHIHLGFNQTLGFRRDCKPDHPSHPVLDDPTMIVKLLDVLLGNTCVLLDRDPSAAARREFYGRAGEYRLPAHGLEYRVLSNFWLRSYPLTAFVWGMARFAAGMALQSMFGKPIMTATNVWDIKFTGSFEPVIWNSAEELLGRVDMEDVRRAINTNDFDLAMKNWQAVRGFLGAYTGSNATAGDNVIPITAATIDDFDHLIETGIDHWFPKHQTMIRWLCTSANMHQGWDWFLTNRVRTARSATSASPHKKKAA